MVSYSPSIVTMAVSLAISEIFSVKEWSDLEIWVWSRLRSLKMARIYNLCMTFYWSAIVVTIALSCTVFDLWPLSQISRSRYYSTSNNSTSIKSCMIYPMVPFSVILSDAQPTFQGHRVIIHVVDILCAQLTRDLFATKAGLDALAMSSLLILPAIRTAAIYWRVGQQPYRPDW